MIDVYCDCRECKFNDDGMCEAERIDISDDCITAGGFIPQCLTYEEKEEENDR